MLEAFALNVAVPVEPALIADLPSHEVRLTLHGEEQVCSGALLADRCNGAALDEAEGPLRIAVQGDQREARSVRQVANLRVVELA
ncbi:MAG: hypothetical protein ACK4IC_00355 [Erythrobacter sp.]